MRIGSLFSGYGGLDLAVESVFGATTAWVADVDPGPRKILAHRFPHAPNLGDVTAVDWGSVEPVDIIAGGSPCQDVSHAGRRAGMTAGTRSNLWSAMREAIATIRPSLVIWENVRGVMSAEADSAMEPCPGCVGDPRDRGPVLRALGRVLGDLASLGYVGQWHGLRAADIGACHGRWRVFVIAYPAGNPWRIEHRNGGVVAYPVGGGRHGGAPDPLGRAIGRTAPARGGEDAERRLTLLPTPRSSDTNGDGAHGKGGLDLRTTINLLPTVRTKNNENRQSEGYGGKDGNFHGLLTGQSSWGDYAAAIRRHEYMLGRPAPSPTEPAAKRLNRHGNPRANPRLSPRFVEWLMCLPDGWVTGVPGVTRNEALKALGNGVVPTQAEAALRLMLAREAAA